MFLPTKKLSPYDFSYSERLLKRLVLLNDSLVKLVLSTNSTSLLLIFFSIPEVLQITLNNSEKSCPLVINFKSVTK